MVHKLRLALPALLILVAAAVIARPWDGAEPHRTAAQCSERHEGEGDRTPANPMYAGPRAAEAPCGDRPGHPESFADLARANGARAARSVSPGTRLQPGAFRAAVAERAELPRTGGTWTPYGNTPLVGDRAEYDTTNGSTRQGLADLAGRVTSFAADPSGDHLFAAASNGGVWLSTDRGDSWSPIGDALPTQVVSGMAWTPADGGTLIVLTGDNAFGGDSIAGLGVYRTNDLGAHWTHAAGVPDGVLGFKVAVDLTHPERVYAATGGGLFRSTDAGASFTNVNLPTGDCAGRPVSVKDCFLANVVTDVVVQGPANATTAGDDAAPGAVLAAVGWRAGQKANADGSQQSPANGMYRSDSGAPGSFENLDFAGNSTPIPPDVLTQARIGRIALGIADGADQNHRVVYALVQDAVKFNGGVTGLDANETFAAAAQSDYLNGLWASTDFGRTWQMIEGSTVIDNDVTSNSALAPPTCKTPAVISYCPGIQAWYNLWVQPDPTQSTASGVPTRLAFGLEELWQAEDSGGLDGSPNKAEVVGRYYAGETCTLLNATNGLPVCPVAEGGTVPKTTTHPDQHGYLWLPDDTGGGVTLFAGHDGGVSKQHLAPGESLSNDNWGRGANNGMNTLQPYDAAMAKDGTLYMGLQDNGEGKIDPDGRAYTVFGGDGFFTAVDPDNADHAFEEYVGGDIAATKDGGKTWTDIQPANIDNAAFSTPFEMDATDANHLVIGGRDVEETTKGVDTSSDTWTKVYDLGTQKHPGDANASATDDDPANQLSAVDVRSFKVPGDAPTGPKTQDLSKTGGENTLPGGQELVPGTFPPGTYEDTPFTIGKDDGDASVLIDVRGETDSDDWDLYVYRDDGNGTLTELGRSASESSHESVNIPNPEAGRYVIRVVNFAAAGQYSLTATFTQRTDPSGAISAAYVGFCGYCDTITEGTPFGRGIATNVGGDKPGKAGTNDGWHIAKAAGLPERLITSVRVDPADPRTVYVTLAGYGRDWAFPGAVGEDTSKVGTGHVFKSTDAGETFTDVSGDLPDAPAAWSALHDGHLIVGTDTGVYESCDNAGGAYSLLGGGLPAAPISTLRFKPGDPDLLVAATYGRGIYTYRFGADDTRCAAKVAASGTGKPCATAAGFRRAKVSPRRRGLRVAVSRRVKQPFTADVFRSSRGRRVINKRVAHFAKRTGSFTWKARHARAGYYTVRLRLNGDTRRFVLVRRHGRFHRRPAFATAPGCTLIHSATLSGPVWGGTNRKRLGVSVRLVRKGTVVITIRRGAKIVKRTTARRFNLRPGELRRGTYRVTISARAASLTQRVVLTSRKL